MWWRFRSHVPSLWPAIGSGRTRRRPILLASDGQDLEAFGCGAPPDDSDRPLNATLENSLQPVADIAAIVEDIAQLLKAEPGGFQHCRRAVAVLHIGSEDDHHQEQPEGVGQDVAFAALHLLTSIPPGRAVGLPEDSLHPNFRRFR